ncbi:hypothetical protein Cgig2_009150 [Carnegiea gigantea]|uniref:Uncharacterized protein n=1 Tax=Carnegiea gigantea TaxID=171969 RepID=A0A9Q1GNU3_9CARY|nr:hypothetical protein Cgig2_009150 [Carnegiea gigantea]
MVPKKSRSTSVTFIGEVTFPLLKLSSPSSILHCAINLAIFMKQKSEKSDLLLYPPNIRAQPFSYGQHFWERKDGAQPCGSTLAFYAADRIRVSSKIPQPSYSYETQVLRGIGPKSLRAMLFEFFNESKEGAPLAVLWTVLKLEWASIHLVVGLTWNIERIMHLASLCFLSLNFDFVFDYQEDNMYGTIDVPLGFKVVAL